MEKEINALQFSFEHLGVNITIINHSNIDDMRCELEGVLGDDDDSFNLVVDETHAVTIGTVEDDGTPKIAIFIPSGYSAAEYNEIIAHESTHATLAIMRYLSFGSFHSTVIVVTDEENEEQIAESCGRIASIIHDCMDAFSTKTAKMAFAKGISFYGKENKRIRRLYRPCLGNKGGRETS